LRGAFGAPGARLRLDFAISSVSWRWLSRSSPSGWGPCGRAPVCWASRPIDPWAVSLVLGQSSPWRTSRTR
jgi:hypothetical protein